MDEIVDILQAAWAGGPFSFNGEHYQFNPVLIRTGSIHIPLIFGGTSKRALQSVVRGNGWHNPSSADLDECLDVKKNILSLLSDAGRSSDDFKFHIRIMEPTLKNVDAYRLAGFRDLSVSTQRLWTVPTEVPLQQKLDDIERISRELGL
jgi:alkanesulfonate monooxygenase SsuD/methylene tetrahydromethanopterin reductase-like flavin-dependent oxidoreductase (luciferase family)